MCSNDEVQLPEKIDAWTRNQPDQVYDRRNLYDYIDGGAELYLSYGFKKVRSRTYGCEGQPDIIVDLFDMGNSYNACGIFTHSRESLDTTFGQGSQYFSGQLLFWKDRYYISILASPETEESKEAVHKLAFLISESIVKKGPLPDILKLLPEEDLVGESVRYFRHHSWLNSFYFIAQENILHITDRTDAVLAKYRAPEARYFLLIIKYDSIDETIGAYQSFLENYLPELSESPIVQIEDGRWTGCQRISNYLVAIFNSPDRDHADRLMSAVQKKITD